MYRPSDNRWQHRHKRCFPTTFQTLSQLGNISRVSSGMTSKSVACVLVSHSKWKTSLCVPRSGYRSNKRCSNTSGRFQVHLKNRMNNKRLTLFTTDMQHRWQHVCRYRSLYSVKMLQGCWLHVSGDVSWSVHSFRL
jgi:hypothetical protein